MKMKLPPLPQKTPIKSTLLPWKKHEVLPPENPKRKDYVASTKPVEVPDGTTFNLLDIIVEDVDVSRTKARKDIMLGKVTVNGEVVRDPDARVDAGAEVRYFPREFLKGGDDVLDIKPLKT